MILSKIKFQTTQITKVILLTLLVSFSFSCSPEDGKDGAPGPQGNPGTDGNANVIISDWFQIEFDNINVANDHGTMIIPIENLDANIENGAATLMYVKESYGLEYIISPLPYRDIIAFQYVNSEENGEVLMVGISNSDVSDLENIPEITLQYVLIPKNTSARMNKDYSKMSYEDLMNHLELE